VVIAVAKQQARPSMCATAVIGENAVSLSLPLSIVLLRVLRSRRMRQVEPSNCLRSLYTWQQGRCAKRGGSSYHGSPKRAPIHDTLNNSGQGGLSEGRSR